jgi:hypothetical protein
MSTTMIVQDTVLQECAFSPSISDVFYAKVDYHCFRVSSGDLDEANHIDENNQSKP